MYFTHLSGIAHYPESAYPRPITVFKSSGPRSSFFRSFAICTSTVRVWIGTVICHADASRKFREQMCPEWSSSVMNSWYSVVVRWMRQPCLWTEKSLSSIPSYMSSCGPPYRSSDNRWNKNIIARLLSCDIYCGTATYPAIITKELYFQVQQLRNEKSVSYSSVLQSFRDDMQCCCGERLYWYPKTHQWYCRHCGMWSNRIRPEELSQQLREKLFWICRHNERICSPQGASNIHSIESSRLSHEINTLLASPEPDAESIVRKILHRAELQFTCCSAGDADPATLQIKRACNELEPTDTFPLKLYAEIVSNVILYRDTHIEIKLRNGQIL